MCVTHYEEFDKIRSLESVKKCLTDYESIKYNALPGHFGKTAQYWLQYCHLVSLQEMLHDAVNINEFDWRLQCWKVLLPHCLGYNKAHCVRYGRRQFGNLASN